nr:hypothetical protein [Tanacetum cinerariifolium]
MTFKIPHKMERFKDIEDLNTDNIPPFFVASEGDEEKGEGYFSRKRMTHYSECLKLGPEYKRDEESWRQRQNLLLTPSRFHGEDVNPKSDGITLADKEKPIEDSTGRRLQKNPSDAQYQKEVNELHAERIARNANPLELVATDQPNQDPYYQTLKPHKPYAPTSKASIPTRSYATTRNKGKEITKPITPPFESDSKEDSDPEQAQRDKDMQKKLALITKYFKKIYKPTNNNLRTSSNSRNKNVDNTLRYKNDNQSGQFGSQRIMNVAEARENIGSSVVQQSRIKCYNYKEFGHFAKECRKPKRVKDFAYHKKKMLLT